LTFLNELSQFLQLLDGNSLLFELFLAGVLEADASGDGRPSPRVCRIFVLLPSLGSRRKHFAVILSPEECPDFLSFCGERTAETFFRL
jgi:hypothetical protein